MGEIFSLIKTAAWTVLFVMLLQVHIGALTIEEHISDWYSQSRYSRYMDEVAQGGALVVKNAYYSTASFIARTLGASGLSDTQNASRLNLEFKRSSQINSGN